MTNTEAAILLTQVTVSAGAIGYLGYNYFKEYNKNLKLSDKLNQHRYCYDVNAISSDILRQENESLRLQLDNSRRGCEKLNTENKSLHLRNELLKSGVEDAKKAFGLLQTRANILESFTRVETAISDGSELNSAESNELLNAIENTVKKTSKGGKK